MEKNFLLGVGITNAKTQYILEYILTSLKKASDRYYIVTPNPEILTYALHHYSFKKILNQARLALPDGIGVILAGKIWSTPFLERITGVDFMELLCKEIAKKPITVGFLGGGQGIAEKTAECLQGRYPGLKVVFAASEWGKKGFVGKEELGIRNKELGKRTKSPNSSFIIHNSIDILFIAFGFPKQEQFMAEHLGKIPVKVMMGVGGAFDYISGKAPRAPLLIRSIGFEWLYRLVMQPWRIKRQLALLEFIYLILKQKLS